MRLIMRVSHSDCEWSYTNVYPILYASKQDFLDDLELAFIDMKDQHQKCFEATAKICRDSKNGKITHTQSRLLHVSCKNAYELKDYVLVGDNRISLSDLENVTGSKFNFQSPEVFTVDEFFSLLETNEQL